MVFDSKPSTSVPCRKGAFLNKQFLTTKFGLVIITSKCNKFIFVPNCAYIVNLTKFPQTVCKMMCSQTFSIIIRLSWMHEWTGWKRNDFSDFNAREGMKISRIVKLVFSCDWSSILQNRIFTEAQSIPGDVHCTYSTKSAAWNCEFSVTW